MNLVVKLAAAAVATFAFAMPAQAVVLNFVVTGSYSASFSLASSPVPDEHGNGSFFTISNVGGFPDAVEGVGDVTFYNGALGGGIVIVDVNSDSYLLVRTEGAQLYTGSEAAPTFKTGTFALTQSEGPGTYTLTIADLSAGTVPEPATWALMIGGFAMVGAAARRRRFRTA